MIAKYKYMNSNIIMLTITQQHIVMLMLAQYNVAYVRSLSYCLPQPINDTAYAFYNAVYPLPTAYLVSTVYRMSTAY